MRGGGKTFSKSLEKSLRKTFPAALLFVLAACARPLSHNEAAFAEALFGDTLDAGAVKVHAGIGLTPLPAPTPTTELAPPRTPPGDVCTRVPQTTRHWHWPAAFVLFDDVFFSYDFYRADTFAGWPASVPVAGLVMAHELVHVWQWQNRKRTHYSPGRAGGEAVEQVDPYYWQSRQAGGFFDYGFEQQAAMIEDYVCFQLFAPDAPEVAELEAVLAPVLTLKDFRAWLRP